MLYLPPSLASPVETSSGWKWLETVNSTRGGCRTSPSFAMSTTSTAVLSAFRLLAKIGACCRYKSCWIPGNLEEAILQQQQLTVSKISAVFTPKNLRFFNRARQNKTQLCRE